MFLGDPPRTQADLSFSLFDIPVRIHPFFWLVAAVLGIHWEEPVRVLLWVFAVFVSVLVHEMGHALTAKAYGKRPWVTLYGLGGLASYEGGGHNPRQRITILLAGPGAGFLLAALVIAAVWLVGQRVAFVPWLVPIAFEHFTGRDHLNDLIWFLLMVNILWGLVNLLPVYPLDGGQIAREILVERNPWEGIKQSLWLSIFAGGGVAVFALVNGSLFIAVMFGFLAVSSYMTLKNYRGHGGW